MSHFELDIVISIILLAEIFLIFWFWTFRKSVLGGVGTAMEELRADISSESKNFIKKNFMKKFKIRKFVNSKKFEWDFEIFLIF